MDCNLLDFTLVQILGDTYKCQSPLLCKGEGHPMACLCRFRGKAEI
jgi:hypothetical protein